MSCVVGLKRVCFALRFLSGILCEYVLDRVMLSFTAGGHPVIDAVEQNENGQSRERANAEADEQALDQSGTDRNRWGCHFHYRYLIFATGYLGNVNVLEISGEPIV